MTHLATIPSPDTHLSQGGSGSLPVGRHPRGPPPQVRVGAGWRGVNVLRLFQTRLLQRRKRLRRRSQRFLRMQSLAPEPRFDSRGLSACKNWKMRRCSCCAKCLAAELQARRGETDLATTSSGIPKTFSRRLGLVHLCVCLCAQVLFYFQNESVEDKHSCHGDGATFRTPCALGPEQLILS